MLESKIRVLYTIPNFDTAGSGKALMNLARGLDKNKFEVHIMCKHDRGSFFKTVKYSGFPTYVYNYETLMRPLLKGLSGCFKVSRIFKEINPDIIHSFHYSADYSEALAARMARCRWVFTKKNMSWGGASKNAWHLRSYFAKAIVIQNTDMIKRFYPKSKKTTVIPRGVNTQYFTKETNSNGAKPLEKRAIVCVANLVPIKGVEILLEAFRKINTENFESDWYVKVVGADTSKYGLQLKYHFQDLIKKKKLVFTGKVLDVKSELQSSEIFVLPTLSKGEGSPVSVLEAMSMGLITLGSRIPGIKDQLIPLDEKYLFEPGNVEDLAKKLKTFMNLSDEQICNIGQEISEYCRSNWDISIEVKKHEQFYLKTLGFE